MSGHDVFSSQRKDNAPARRTYTRDNPKILVSAGEGWLYIVWAGITALHFTMLLNRTAIPYGGIVLWVSTMVFLLACAILSAKTSQRRTPRPRGFHKRLYYAFALPCGFAVLGVILEAMHATPELPLPIAMLLAALIVMPMFFLGVSIIRAAAEQGKDL
ncbi:hypothetical protein [Arcanobacterium bovis]|uniref:Uncharacterized protein n=1 Tax=Arcanobacterium bovis TaxID=2529275 RepID=A0A4Q9V214_9ACTO|nr:hypothetical protein [Arcanobacterium bovis]TBW23675.1 hypothetical protein EZJ44_00590 [Arcanobacterium bovis]